MAARRCTVRRVDPALAELPFYRARLDGAGGVAPWTLDDLEDWAAASGDPYGGRRAEGTFPPLSLQLEAAGEPYLWVGVDTLELEAWSAALEHLLGRWGVGAGATVAYFEYGSSPLVLLSAGSYVPHLAGGAADRLGADTFCNDGLGSMAVRMVDTIRLLQPAVVVLRADVLAPFAEAVDVTGLALAEAVGCVAVTMPEGVPFPAEVDRYSQRWGMAVRRLLRADAVFLVAGDCTSTPPSRATWWNASVSPGWWWPGPTSPGSPTGWWTPFGASGPAFSSCSCPWSSPCWPRAAGRAAPPATCSAASNG